MSMRSSQSQSLWVSRDSRHADDEDDGHDDDSGYAERDARYYDEPHNTMTATIT